MFFITADHVVHLDDHDVDNMTGQRTGVDYSPQIITNVQAKDELKSIYWPIGGFYHLTGFGYHENSFNTPEDFVSVLDKIVIDKVRALRKEHNMTQREFEDAINLSSGYVGDIEAERGSVKYSLFHINEIAKDFKCSLWDLLPQYPLT